MRYDRYQQFTEKLGVPPITKTARHAARVVSATVRKKAASMSVAWPSRDNRVPTIAVLDAGLRKVGVVKVDVTLNLVYVDRLRWRGGRWMDVTGSHNVGLKTPDDTASITVNVLLNEAYHGTWAEDGFSDGDAKDLEWEVEMLMLHELTHAYENAMRPIGTHRDSMQDAVARVDLDMMRSLFMVMYLTAGYEQNARVPSVLPYLRGAKTTLQKERALKKSGAWSDAEYLLGFDARAEVKKLLSRASRAEVAAAISAMQFTAATETFREITVMARKYVPSSREADFTREMLDSAKRVIDTFKYPLEDLYAYWERRAHRVGKRLKHKLLKVTAYEEPA